jgi:peptidoglycan/LPS O-acetylase OafA/YrhL
MKAWIKARLARVVTRGRIFIPEVDGLRFVAITAVVLYHLRDFTPRHQIAAQPIDSYLSRLVGVGHYGVELFFILSGFLLAMPFAKWRVGLGPKPSLQTYYSRRLTRLEPPFLLAMVLIFLLGLAVHLLVNRDAGKWAGISDWPHFLATLIYQHNVIYGETSRITPVEWSLEIEVQFYVLAPLIARLFSIHNKIIRRGIFLGLILGVPTLRRLLLPSQLGKRFDSLPWHIEFFLVGFVLVDLFLLDWKETPSRSVLWDMASLIGWPAMIALTSQSDQTGNLTSIFIAPTALLCYLGTFRGRWSSWLLSRPQFTMIGGMCYSIYLLHYTIMMSANKLLKQLALFDLSFAGSFSVAVLVTLPAIVFVCGVFFAFCERPCMDPSWPSRVGRYRRGLLGGHISPELHPGPSNSSVTERASLCHKPPGAGRL